MYVVLHRKAGEKWKPNLRRRRASAEALRDQLKANGTADHVRIRYIDFEDDQPGDWKGAL